MEKPSHIFTGFRALGFVSNHVPLCVRYNQRHKDNYVVTCVGKAFQVYNCSKLGIVSVSDAHPEPITCTAVDGVHVYTAYSNVIQAFTRGRQVRHTYRGHDKVVHLLLPFGHHLISVDVASSVKVWDIHSQEIFLEFGFDNGSFEISTMVHPNTYLNKVLFGSRQGSLQLWNLQKNKQLYNFPGWGSAVLVLEQAPAIDVIAVGLADGRIMIHNIKFDETIMTFTQDWGPVTAIAFRTDGHPVMASGSTLGHIALWNLEEKRLQSQMRDCHNGTISAICCLPSEPLMVTSSPDNSLKVWIFDMPDGSGRLLRQRRGHSAPPVKAHYYGDRGQAILSAGQDSTLHSFSTEHENKNKCLGRASYNKKLSKASGLRLDQHMMPAVTAFSAEKSRESDWDSIVTCHRGEKLVMTWNYQKGSMGAHKLSHTKFDDVQLHKHTTAQCVEISGCGNFVLVGYSSGDVDLYNIQSGIHRGSYGKPTAHKGQVRGVAIDGLNQLVITAGADRCIRFWKFKSKQLLDTVRLETQPSRVLLHRDSSLLAVSMDNFDILILDTDTKKIVRKFTGHGSSITDMTFSLDSRWLVTSSMDSSVRTWDIPTGRLVDCFLVDNAVTSLCMSPTSDFLVTTHVDDLGIYLWSNMTLYAHVNLTPLPSHYEPSILDMPSTGALSEELLEDGEEVKEYEVAAFKSAAQISDELVTLSLLPNSRWLSLINLDVIKQRNRPKQPPKVPKAAPFFLPTLPGLQPKFVLPEEDKDDQIVKKVFTGHLQPLTRFGKALTVAAADNSFGDVLVMMREMGPSAIDAELRTLSPEGGGSVQLMAHFLTFISHVIKSNKDFELIQAYLGLFLKIHGDSISREPALIQLAEQIQTSQQDTWQQIQTLFNQSSCLVTYLKSATL